MEEEDTIIVKWAQEDVETLYNLPNNNNQYIVDVQFSLVSYVFTPRAK